MRGREKRHRREAGDALVDVGRQRGLIGINHRVGGHNTSSARRTANKNKNGPRDRLSFCAKTVAVLKCDATDARGCGTPTGAKWPNCQPPQGAADDVVIALGALTDRSWSGRADGDGAGHVPAPQVAVGRDGQDLAENAIRRGGMNVARATNHGSDRLSDRVTNHSFLLAPHAGGIVDPTPEGDGDSVQRTNSFLILF